MSKADAIKPPSRLSWIVLLAMVFLTIAGISSLIAWAAALREDTLQRRMALVPQIALSVTGGQIASHIQQALSAPETLAAIEPQRKVDGIDVEPLPSAIEKTNGKNNAEITGFPWKIYAAKYNRSESRPKVAIIVTGLGLRQKETDSALNGLPALVTLGFSPYAENLTPLIKKARDNNQEALLELPMQPIYFPNSDPGPRALLTTQSWEQNAANLNWAASRATGNVGLLASMGSRYLSDEKSMRPLLAEIKNKGLLFVDNGSAINSQSAVIAAELQAPSASVNLWLDTDLSKAAIESKLKELEQQAKANGFATGLIRAYPVSIASIRTWIATLDSRGLALVPITAMVDAQVR